MNGEETVIVSGRGCPSKFLLIWGILFSWAIVGFIHIKNYFDYKKSWVTVTNTRIMGVTVRKETVDLPLNAVLSAVISDNGWGCFLTVLINSNNNKPLKVVFPQVENNILICNAINQLVAAGTDHVQSQMPRQPEVQQPVQPQMQQPMQPQMQQPEVQQPVQPQMQQPVQPQMQQPEVQQPVQPQMQQPMQPQMQQPEVQQPVQPQMQQPMQPQMQQPMQQTSQSVADELKKFKELLDCGVITQQEFDDKKHQLLNQ